MTIMENQPTAPANQEPAKNKPPKKTWQEPELVNLSLKGGLTPATTETFTATFHSS